MFSYGSGLAATQFSLHIRRPVLDIRNKTNVSARLHQRTPVDPVEYDQVMADREASTSRYNYTVPRSVIAPLAKGTYYLTSIDGMERRSYARALSTLVRASRTLLV